LALQLFDDLLSLLVLRLHVLELVDPTLQLLLVLLHLLDQLTILVLELTSLPVRSLNGLLLNLTLSLQFTQKVAHLLLSLKVLRIVINLHPLHLLSLLSLLF
jgi:hypothetical protein